MSRPPVEAVLQAGDTETLYRRAGDGPPVLLLCTGVLADPLGGRLFERLATRARVIAPACPAGSRATDILADWLAEVSEGLGLERPSVVIDEGLASALLDGELAASERFASVIVAVAGGSDASERAADLARRGAHVVPVVDDDASAVAAAVLLLLGER
ncbi:MAG TPA: hypothetical protein VM261_22140 [Kofleriaceae bacterium]|nr:hypothetical protein [Kofleriaceae bacterium]